MKITKEQWIVWFLTGKKKKKLYWYLNYFYDRVWGLGQVLHVQEEFF